MEERKPNITPGMIWQNVNRNTTIVSLADGSLVEFGIKDTVYGAAQRISALTRSSLGMMGSLLIWMHESNYIEVDSKDLKKLILDTKLDNFDKLKKLKQLGVIK